MIAVAGVASVTLVAALAALALQDGASNDPFFSNDAVGFIKVLAFFAGIAGVVIGVIIKITSGGIKNDLTNLGAKLDRKTTDDEREFARLDERISSAVRDQAGTTRDITTLITATAGEMNRSIVELQVEIARMQERDRLSQSLDRFRTELRDDLRADARDKSRGEKK